MAGMQIVFALWALLALLAAVVLVKLIRIARTDALDAMAEPWGDVPEIGTDAPHGKSRSEQGGAP